MRHIKDIVFESLLDDELEDKVDDIAYSNILNKNNRFLFDGSLTLHNIKYGGKQFLEPHTYSNGKVILNSTQEVSQKKSFDIKKYIDIEQEKYRNDVNAQPSFVMPHRKICRYRFSRNGFYSSCPLCNKQYPSWRKS